MSLSVSEGFSVLSLPLSPAPAGADIMSLCENLNETLKIRA